MTDLQHVAFLQRVTLKLGPRHDEQIEAWSDQSSIILRISRLYRLGRFGTHLMPPCKCSSCATCARSLPRCSSSFVATISPLRTRLETNEPAI